MISDKKILDLLYPIPANDEHLPLLIQQFSTREGVVPFVGAGMSFPMGFPLWDTFLLELADEANIRQKIKDRLSASQYEEAASDLLEALQPRRFQDLLKSHFGDDVDDIIAKRRLTGAVTELPKFPVGPIVTTNFDRVLEAVFKKAGREVRAFWHSQASKGSEALQQGKPFVLKLHGDWEDSATRILTLDEYEKAYGTVTSTGYKIGFDRPLPALLFTLLSGRCCLFLGCSLRQDRNVQLLRAIARGIPDLVHYAIVEQPVDQDEFRRRAEELSAQSIRPIWYPPGRHDLIQPLLSYLAVKAKEGLRATLTRALAPASPRRAVPNNIPDLGNLTVGREEEVRQMLNMLRGARVISVTGAGGCGKSRLAIEVAAAAKSRYEDGVWFIPLADMAKKADKEKILPARIGRIVGVPEQAGRPPNEALAEHLSSGKYLLVLDNCEHLIGSCKETASYLLQECPDLTILATTRRPLKLPQERIFPIAPLKTPELDSTSCDELAKNDSVRLFVERARQRSPGYMLDPSNALAVSELCRTLDGIPLAIEIAAARLGVKSVEEMNRESSDLLGTIGNIKSGDLLRWKTLTAALRWSYGLLQPHEQRFMSSLAVFDGGWTEKAAEAVYRRPVSDHTPVLDHLQVLHESSLVVSTDIRGSKRFRFLEPVRQLAQLQLAPDETAECERRHAQFFLNLAELAAPELLKSQHSEWLDKLQAEADNLRAAIRWSVATQNAETGLRLINALWRFTEIRGYLTEGRERAAEVLDIPGVEHFPEYRSKVLSGAGMLAYRQADFDTAERMFEESLGLEEKAENDTGIANAVNDLGNVARMKGEYSRARDLYTRSLNIVRKNNNQRAIAVANFNLGSVALAVDDGEECADLLSESLRGFRAVGDEWETGYPLNGLGMLNVATGNLQSAEEYGQQSLAVRQKAKDTKGIADTLRTLGWASIAAKDIAKARERLSESMSLARGVGDKRGISETLELFGLLSSACGLRCRAIRLFAAAEQIREGFTYSLPKSRIAQRETALAAARESVGELEYDRAWRHGSSLSLTAAIEEALKSEDPEAESGLPAPAKSGTETRKTISRAQDD